MEYTAEVYSALCSLAEFTINGVTADESDFVDKYDHSPETASDYACGDMQADIIPATDKVLKKYGITAAEYATIAADVVEKVSFGCCGWCV
ncbi:MAG: hypothetical protein ACYCX0_11030 [Desulfurivibrionaceae bacterium]